MSNSVTDLYRAVHSCFSPSCCRETQIQSCESWLHVSLFLTTDEETAGVSGKTDNTVHLWWNSFNLVARHLKMASPAVSAAVSAPYYVNIWNHIYKHQNSPLMELWRGSLNYFFARSQDHSIVVNALCWNRNSIFTHKRIHTVYVWIYLHVVWNPLVSQPEAFCCVLSVLPWPSLWEFCCSCCCCCLLANFFIWKEGVRLVRTPKKLTSTL